MITALDKEEALRRVMVERKKRLRSRELRFLREMYDLIYDEEMCAGLDEQNKLVYGVIYYEQFSNGLGI